MKKISLEVGENYTDKELHDMIAEADKSGDGQITFDEFFRVMRKKCNDPLGEFDSDDYWKFKLISNKKVGLKEFNVFPGQLNN